MYFPQKVFYGVFELPLLRNAQKRHKKKRKKYLPTPFIICPGIRRFQFYFSSAPLGAFELVMQRNGQKRDKKRPKGKNDRLRQTAGFFSLNFFGKKFSTWISPKLFLWSF
jgi:hypothetical protein